MARLGDTGDHHALAVLYKRYGRLSYALARRICREDSIAQDAVQEAFVALWQLSSRFDPQRGAVSTWLLTMVHHRAVDVVRRERTRTQRRALLSRDEMENAGPSLPGADAGVLSGEVAGQVRDALLELPVHQRQVLVLVYYGGYTQREVASHLGLPLGTVKSRCFVAMRRLRTALQALLLHDDAGS